MKYSIGDRVIITDDNSEGEICAIRYNGVIMVVIYDGSIWPVTEDQLIPAPQPKEGEE